MDEQAHIDRIRANGWSQGHILSPAVAEAARTCGDRRWPQHLNIDTARDWLVIVSHPCDVRNRRPGKEPTAEVLLYGLIATAFFVLLYAGVAVSRWVS